MNVAPWSTVAPGTTGPVVTGIQYLLRARAHAVAADGIYGPATGAAVAAFQVSAGLPSDGIVGPDTWPHLVLSTGPGSSGDAVRAVQQFGLLTMPGDEPLEVDGEYGPITTERVSFFQESWGLSIDGFAGPETWSFLSTALPGPRPWPLVKQGATQATNWRVLAAQHLLRAKGHDIVADGDFGLQSGGAVISFQQTLRDTEIGPVLGQLDWPALIVTISEGDSGDAVRAAQSLLGGGLAVDGEFGPQTDQAVRAFQSAFAPPSDGIVGPVTWHALTLRIFD
ncbi:MAG TPA: peptidoglycan-binding protein [Microbacterium sp.]|nr:peptidoglycan-binding protein [Microbacterium sp.]